MPATLNNLLFFFSQNRTFSYFTVLVALALITFLFSWLTEPRKLINGVFFTFFIAALAAWFTFLVYATNLPSFRKAYLAVGVALVGAVAAIVFFSWVLLLWNSYVVLKHESHTLPNLLTLILAIGMLAIWIFIFLTHIPPGLGAAAAGHRAQPGNLPGSHHVQLLDQPPALPDRAAPL